MNHVAIVAKVDRVEEIPGADKIQVAYVLGERVVVSKGIGVGYVGLLFPAELQLSVQFCHYNNLFRDSEKNADQTQRGFFDDNRKVRAQPFMKIKSEACFTSLESLNYLGEGAKATLSALKLGDQFAELEGNMICQKFISAKTKQAISDKKGKYKVSDKPKTPLFHEHVDTAQFKHNVHRIPKGAVVSFHSKMHGTSARYGKTLVVRHPLGMKGWLNRVALKATRGRWKPFAELSGYDYVAGTRRVVLYKGQENKAGFNGPEGWRFAWLERLKPYLDDGLTIYGEIYGYANGRPIMTVHSTDPLGAKSDYAKKYGKEMVYKYGCPEGTNDLMIYRISYTSPEGVEIDFTLDQLIAWCTTRGFKHTIEVAPRIVYDGNEDTLRQMVESLTERPECLTEDYTDPSHVSEGIVIRVDGEGLVPLFLKSKSFAFKCMEGIATLDTVDEEDAS